MRLHISLDDDLIARLDARVGPRRRSEYIGETVRRALDDEQRWEDVEAAVASIPDRGHDWDADPAVWVRAQRRSDDRRVG